MARVRYSSHPFWKHTTFVASCGVNSRMFSVLVKVHVAQKNVSLLHKVPQNTVKVQNADFLQTLYLYYILLNIGQQTHVFLRNIVRNLLI